MCVYVREGESCTIYVEIDNTAAAIQLSIKTKIEDEARSKCLFASLYIFHTTIVVCLFMMPSLIFGYVGLAMMADKKASSSPSSECRNVTETTCNLSQLQEGLFLCFFLLIEKLNHLPGHN